MKDFHNALRARDPLGIGFSETLNPLLDLVSGLLTWNPRERLTAADALKHNYFATNDSGGNEGTGTAVEPQMLDPRFDIKKEEIPNTFICPKCGRSFDNLQSCQMHARTRNHAKFCSYDRANLPKCLNAHPMLPSHPTSGKCLSSECCYHFIL
jgi:serine/threonine protein kinase